MNQPSAETTTTKTFVVRFWREWSGAESRWRGRIEHVQSGQRVDFLDVNELLRFLRRMGVGIDYDVANSRTGQQRSAE